MDGRKSSSRLHGTPVQLILLGPATALLLTGCFHQINHLQGPLAVRMSDGEISVAVCEDIVAAQLTASSGYEDDGYYFWDAEAAQGAGVHIQEGTILDSRNLEQFFPIINKISQPSDPGSGITVFLISAEGRAHNLAAAFRPNGATDTAGQWFHPNESFTTAPCK